MNYQKIMAYSTALFAMLTSAPTIAQNTSSPTTVNFEVTTQKDVLQDTLTVSFSVQEQGQDLKALNKKLAEKSEKLLALAKKYKVIILVENRYFSYMNTTKNGKFSSWVVRRDIRFRSEDFTAINQLILENDSNVAVSDLSFSVSDKQKQIAEDEMLQEAITQVDSKAKLLSSALKRESYRISNLMINQPNEYYQVRAMKMSSAASQSADYMAETVPEPGYSTIKLSVSAIIELSE